MSKNLKKILVAGASLLMVASVGASAGQVSSPVHASRVSKLLARRNRDYRSKNNEKRDIARINSELNRLRRHHVVRRRRVVRRHKARRHAAKRYPTYSGKWFAQNANRLNKRYGDNDNEYASDGQNDGTSNTLEMHPRENNYVYHVAWVIAEVNGNDASLSDSARQYARANAVYNSGMRYAKSHHSPRVIYHNGRHHTWRK